MLPLLFLILCFLKTSFVHYKKYFHQHWHFTCFFKTDHQTYKADFVVVLRLVLDDDDGPGWRPSPSLGRGCRRGAVLLGLRPLPGNSPVNKYIFFNQLKSIPLPSHSGYHNCVHNICTQLYCIIIVSFLLYYWRFLYFTYDYLCESVHYKIERQDATLLYDYHHNEVEKKSLHVPCFSIWGGHGGHGGTLMSLCCNKISNHWYNKCLFTTTSV